VRKFLKLESLGEALSCLDHDLCFFLLFSPGDAARIFDLLTRREDSVTGGGHDAT